MRIPPPGGGGNKIKGFDSGEDSQCHKIEKGRGKIKSKMFKLKRKKRGVRIWNKNTEYLSVRGSN